MKFESRILHQDKAGKRPGTCKPQVYRFFVFGYGGGGAEGAPGSFYPDCRACWMPGLLDKKGPHIHEMRGPDNTIWVLDIQTYIL